MVDRPAWCRLDGVDPEDRAVQKICGYRDERAVFALQRFTRGASRWTGDPEEYAARVAVLQAEVRCSTLQHQAGVLRAPAGLARPLADALGIPLRQEVVRPRGRPMTWAATPDKVLRDYQVEAVRLLLAAGHGAVSLPPGTGKTLCIMHLVREVGLTATVCSPSSAIVQQTAREFRAALGEDVVGVYGDGEHDLVKPVTVATTQALIRVKGRARAFFKGKRVFAGDESHHLPGDTMQTLAFDLHGDAPYRFFFSGTQQRHDGLQPLLDGIIGDVVLEMSVEEAVNRGALTPMATRILRVRNGRAPRSSDPMKATEEALLASRHVNEIVGALVKQMVASRRPVLILVKTLPQFAALARHLGGLDARFAHGSTDKARLEEARVPEEHRSPDTMGLVDAFNRREYPILIGTSAIGTGVDVRATGAAFYLRGGAAETDMRQYAGRAMRLHTESGKRDVFNFDVDVVDGGIVHRHAEARAKVWRRVFPDVSHVDLGG